MSSFNQVFYQALATFKIFAEENVDIDLNFDTKFWKQILMASVGANRKQCHFLWFLGVSVAVKKRCYSYLKRRTYLSI